MMLSLHKRPFVAPNAVIYSYEVSKRFVPEDATSVLEVGCGLGIFAMRYAAAHPNATIEGVDYSKKTIEFLLERYEKYYPNIKFRAEDFCKRDLNAEKKHDCIYSSDVIEHVTDLEEFVRNIHSHLKNDGVAVINFPNMLDHGINHFTDVSAIQNLFSNFKEIEVYKIDISHPVDWLWPSIRSIYEKLFSSETKKRREALYTERSEQGIDCFEDSTCFNYFKNKSQLMHMAASLLSEALLLIRPTIGVQRVQSGSVLNLSRLVVVAKK